MAAFENLFGSILEDGDLKRSTLEQGTFSMQCQRIYANSKSASCFRKRKVGALPEWI